MAAALCGIVFASGCSALILEALWFRQAGLAFGNSIWASSLVLAGFMSGLGLGNALAGRFGDRTRRPLLLYAGAEAAIAVTGVALVHLFPLLGSILAPWLRPLLDHPWAMNPLRLALAWLCLLVPSTAMGATLPLLTRALSRSDASFGSVLGRLYGWNTAGAVAGVIGGEFLLLGAFGIRGTALAAGALNIAAAAAAASLSGRASEAASLPLPERAGLPRPGGPSVAGAWQVAAFLSGFALLALEVIWFRLLLLAVIGYSAAFAVMLAVVLAGIALGSLATGWWLRRSPDASKFGAATALVAGVLCVASYAVFLLLLSRVQDHLVVRTIEVLTLGVPLMLPVSMASGMFFTLAGAGLRREIASDSATTGSLTLANTIGAALGSLVSGFLLLPLLGMERSLFVVTLLYGGVGVWLALRVPAPSRAPQRSTLEHRVRLGAMALLAASLVFFPFGAMAIRLQAFPVARYESLRKGGQPVTARVSAIREGTAETLIYLDIQILGRPLSHALFVNATSMADTDWLSRRYMKLFVYWPTALHPHLEHSLLIAYGVGNTAKAMTDSDGLKTIDIVDISRDVLDMSTVVYPHDADNPLHDPRVRVHVEDGRYFLQTTSQRFDLITAEPPPPKSAGVVNLYTREYFQLLRSRLAEGGMVAYWLPLHAMSDVTARSVLRAFCDAFEDCSLWQGIGPQLMMAGTRHDTGPGSAVSPVSEDQFVRQWQDPRVADEMRRLGLERPEQLGALFIGDATYVRRIVGDAPPLVDNYPKRIETPPRSPDEAQRFARGLTDTRAARDRFLASALVRTLWPPRMLEASAPFFDAQDAINALSQGGRPSSMEDVHRLLTQSPLKTAPLWLLGSDFDVQRIVEEATGDERAHPAVQFHLGARLLSERRYEAAAEAFRQAEALPDMRTQAFGLRIYALAMSGHIAEARQLVATRVRARPGSALPPFWAWMDRTFTLFAVP